MVSCLQTYSSVSSYPGLRYSPSAQSRVLTMPLVLASSSDLRYLQYSHPARPHVLTMPWVLTKARFQVFTSRISVTTFRQGLRYLTPGQVSGTHIQARPHGVTSRPGTYLQARRYCTHLQARPIVFTFLPRVLISRPNVLTSRQNLRYSPPG